MFKFRYNALLSYRLHLKEKAEIDFAKVQRQLRECNDLMKTYQEGIFQAKSDMDKDLRAGIQSHILMSHSDYIADLKTRIEAQSDEIARVEVLVMEKREVLREKTTQCKIFEKLKERDFQKWRRQQHHLEQKEINETAVLRHGRNYFLG